MLGSLNVILKGPVPKALVAEKVSCPASQFCGDIAKFFSDHAFDIIKIFDNWFKRIGFGSVVLICTVYLSIAFTDEIELIYSLKSEVGCLALNILNTTSSDVIGVPLENFTSFLK